MSQTSIGMGSGLDEGTTDSGNLTPEGGSPPGETVYDYIAYIIYCGDHERIALTRALKQNVGLRAVWLPFVALSSIGTWKVKAEEGVQLILKKENPELESKIGTLKIPVTAPKRIELKRVQIPLIRKFITRLIYFVRLEKSSDFKCCENTKRIQWYSLNDVISGKVKKVWGPEVKFAKMCKTTKIQGVFEYTLKKAFAYFKDSENPKNNEEEILREMGFGQREVEIVYADYLEHCFPSFEMTKDSFKDYLTKHGYTPDDNRLELLFNAFDFQKRGYLEFTHLLWGLVNIDPTAPHRKYRVLFICRYYDRDRDECLNQSEVSALIKDLNPSNDSEAIKQKTTELFKNMNIPTKNSCTYEELAAAVGTWKLRGTSKLCISPKSILKDISKAGSSRESIQLSSLKVASKLAKDKTKDEGSCSQCTIKNYDYALHSVLFNTGGYCVDIRLLSEMGESESEKLKPPRIYSMKFTFSATSIASIFIDMIREFNVKRNRKGLFGELSQRDAILSLMQDMSNTLEQIFSTEERVVRINGPTYVIGDIYGNLNDLLTMESTLWPSFPVISSNYVFLGNYVNYGKWGVECVIYLLSLKILSPNKVFLLRGRHEIRDIQIQNSFQRECFEKYDEYFGKKIWQMINNLFDRLIFGLVVDESIFCTHSGIPNTRIKVQEYNKINAILKNPSVDSLIVWQLITNEPTAQPLKTRTGFSENQGISSRFLFNEVAVNSFLEDNGFTHIVCGNKQTHNGYCFQFGSKFINVFSTSNFKRSKNKSAVLLLSNHKIHIIRLEITKEETKTASLTSVVLATDAKKA